MSEELADVAAPIVSALNKEEIRDRLKSDTREAQTTIDRLYIYLNNISPRFSWLDRKEHHLLEIKTRLRQGKDHYLHIPTIEEPKLNETPSQELTVSLVPKGDRGHFYFKITPNLLTKLPIKTIKKTFNIGGQNREIVYKFTIINSWINILFWVIGGVFLVIAFYAAIKSLGWI